MLPAGPTPPYQINEEFSLQTPVVYDAVPLFSNFGQVITDVNTATPYTPGGSVSAVFWGATPRVCCVPIQAPIGAVLISMLNWSYRITSDWRAHT